MVYLIIEIWFWILVAFILGWFARGFLCCKKDEEATTNTTEQPVVAATTSTAASTDDVATKVEVTPVETPSVDESWKPQGFASAPSDSDELKRIKGIGPVIETTLNELGIYQFKQIAKWDSNNISWVENFLAFPGRINREDWITQAQTLSDGGTTEFAKRVDKGDINY